ncbi:CLUL1 protein, partial [Galbula dea]|nr:CLUL1 protein [Galbula dea]
CLHLTAPTCFFNRKNMKSSWLFIIYVLWVSGYQCAPTRQEEINLQENLKLLSEVGEKYVDEEVKKALIGIKQMKIMMERNEDKHVELMKTLKKSSEEKQQALRLMDEIKERLEEEERQCQVSLKRLWGECESCLESTCMRYYTTCKNGLSSSRRKVEDFLRKIPPLIFTFHEDHGKDVHFNKKTEKEDTQLVKMEDLFSQLLSDMGSMFDRSFIIFKRMQKEFDQSFQTYFMSGMDLNESTSMPALPEDITRNDDSMKGWGIPSFLQSVFDFSKTVFKGVSEVITEVFDEYRDNRRDVPEQVKG